MCFGSWADLSKTSYSLKHFFRFLLLALILMSACDNDNEHRITDSGYDYFPLKVGLYQRYMVDEIRYSQVAEPETLRYELKQVVVDSFFNASNNIVYVIHRSTRPDENTDWQFLETWSARRDSQSAIMVEGNTAYQKLSFPLSKGGVWDGNKFNDLGEDTYTLKEVDVASEVNGTNFDKTLTVEHEFNDDPIVYTDLRAEVYARNIGLIKKETTQLVYCQSQTCSGNELIESGVVYKQEIIEYGME